MCIIIIIINLRYLYIISAKTTMASGVVYLPVGHSRSIKASKSGSRLVLQSSTKYPRKETPPPPRFILRSNTVSSLASVTSFVSSNTAASTTYSVSLSSLIKPDIHQQKCIGGHHHSSHQPPPDPHSPPDPQQLIPRGARLQSINNNGNTHKCPYSSMQQQLLAACVEYLIEKIDRQTFNNLSASKECSSGNDDCHCGTDPHPWREEAKKRQERDSYQKSSQHGKHYCFASAVHQRIYPHVVTNCIILFLITPHLNQAGKFRILMSPNTVLMRTCCRRPKKSYIRGTDPR